jgi:hypothetical protein
MNKRVSLSEYELSVRNNGNSNGTRSPNHITQHFILSIKLYFTKKLKRHDSVINRLPGEKSGPQFKNQRCDNVLSGPRFLTYQRQVIRMYGLNDG